MEDRITIHIATKDRHTELMLLLQSLREQTFQDFDIIILDDASGTPITQPYFLSNMLNQLKLENHRLKLLRNNQSFGCCYARNQLIDEDRFGNSFVLRLDDDVILEKEYIKKLLDVIDKGYDMASGVIPSFGLPPVKRKIEAVGSIINEHKFDKEGNLILNNDDCGFCYLSEAILPTHQFRTNCLYKSEIQKKVRYPNNLTSVAFREEGFFSIGAILEGYKIGVCTTAVAWHLKCPSGGNRRVDYSECVKIDDEIFRKWLKKKFIEKGDFLTKYNNEVLK